MQPDSGKPDDAADSESTSGSRTARVFGLVTRVEHTEVRAATLLMLCVFLILTAYYLIKPAREGWLAVSAVAGLSKLEIKAYASFGQVLLLVGVVRLYSGLVMSWPRGALVVRVTSFLAMNLLLFWALQPGFLVGPVPYLGVAFYLWVGIFNVFIVAQFWAYTADFYTLERGRRLLPLVALGANAGAVFGAWLADFLVSRAGLRSLDLILFAAVPLVVSLGLLVWAERHGPTGEGLDERARSQPPKRGVEASTEGPLDLISRNALLSTTALLTIVYGWVASNGENLLFAAVQAALEIEAAEQGIRDPASLEAFTLAATTGFYGDFFFWVNLLGFALQALVVSRLLRWGGFAPLFLCLPLVSVVGYVAMSVVPALAVIKFAKILENSTNYSIHNTARSVFWLPTTSEMKFKAKQAIDTIFVRVGDGLAALTVLIGVNGMAFSPFRIFWLNVLLCAVWILLAGRVVRERKKLLEADQT